MIITDVEMTVAKTKRIANIRANRLNLAMTMEWNKNFLTLLMFFGLDEANDCCIVMLTLFIFIPDRL